MAYLLLALLQVDHTIALLMILVITFGDIVNTFHDSFWISRSVPQNQAICRLHHGMGGRANTWPATGALLAEQAELLFLWTLSGIMLLSAMGFIWLSGILRLQADASLQLYLKMHPTTNANVPQPAF
jgi:hypothetical protein